MERALSVTALGFSNTIGRYRVDACRIRTLNPHDADECSRTGLQVHRACQRYFKGTAFLVHARYA